MKFEPHAYQRYAIERILSDARLGLFLDMGLGKTVITLTAVNELKSGTTCGTCASCPSWAAPKGASGH